MLRVAGWAGSLGAMQALAYDMAAARGPAGWVVPYLLEVSCMPGRSRVGTPDTSPDLEILTLEEAAAYLSMTPRTLTAVLQGGHLPAARFGSTWRLRRLYLDRALNGEGPGEPPGRPEGAKEVLSLEEAAAYLRILRPTISGMLHRGDITAAHLGSHWRIRRSLLDDALDSSQPKAPLLRGQAIARATATSINTTATETSSAPAGSDAGGSDPGDTTTVGVAPQPGSGGASADPGRAAVDPEDQT